METIIRIHNNLLIEITSNVLFGWNVDSVVYYLTKDIIVENCGNINM